MTAAGTPVYPEKMASRGQRYGVQGKRIFSRLPVLFLAVLAVMLLPASPCRAAVTTLFGYQEKPQKSLDALPHWLSVMERHLRLDMDPSASPPQSPERKRLDEWRDFLDSVRELAPESQIARVNEFANRHEYILDSVNYGVPDYWAIVREFLVNNGDCEDFAITKFFSLRLLGFDDASLRIVILQDTNLRTPHAVLAVRQGGDYVILDNQARQVVRPGEIVHYVPLYAVNETGWWLYLPPF